MALTTETLSIQLPGLTYAHDYEMGDIVALQGPNGIQGPHNIEDAVRSYHRIGAEQRFGTDVITEGMESFKQVFDAVECGDARFGIVALRSMLVDRLIGDEGAEPNSLIIRKRGLVACGPLVSVDVRLDLFGAPGTTLDNIDTVARQGTANVGEQCRDWLGAKLPRVRQIDCEDGLIDAGRLLERTDSGRLRTAVIASPEAAKLGLVTLQPNIQNDGARTVFRVFTRAA